MEQNEVPAEAMEVSKPSTKTVLEWLKVAAKNLYEDPSDQNVTAFVAEVSKNKEVVVDALLDALKPEFRYLGETISGLLVPGIRKEEKDMVRADD